MVKDSSITLTSKPWAPLGPTPWEPVNRWAGDKVPGGPGYLDTWILMCIGVRASGCPGGWVVGCQDQDRYQGT